MTMSNLSKVDWQVPEWTEQLEKTLQTVKEEREELVRSLEAERVLLEETRLIQKALEEKREAIVVDSEEMQLER